MIYLIINATAPKKLLYDNPKRILEGEKVVQ